MVIVLILYLTYRSVIDTLLLMISVLGALAGGAIFQWLFGFPFSVAVWVGYIACFGMAVETGVVMLVYLREAIEERGGVARITSIADLRQAILEGAVHRLRPKLLTEARRSSRSRRCCGPPASVPRLSGPWPRPCWAGCSSPTRSSTSCGPLLRRAEGQMDQAAHSHPHRESTMVQGQVPASLG